MFLYNIYIQENSFKVKQNNKWYDICMFYGFMYAAAGGYILKGYDNQFVYFQALHIFRGAEYICIPAGFNANI